MDPITNTQARYLAFNGIMALQKKNLYTVESFRALDAEMQAKTKAAGDGETEGDGGTGTSCSACCDLWEDDWLRWFNCGSPFGYGCPCAPFPGA